jgi:hypothetical protein
MLTNKNLESENPNEIGGINRVYRFSNGWGLSLINSPMAHAYKYAWEAAVLNPDGNLDYSTILTQDVEVFRTEVETNAFIEKARKYFEKNVVRAGTSKA